MWRLCKPAEGITHSKYCIFCTLPSLSSFHSSFCVFLLFDLICSSLPRLPHFLFPLQPLPSQLLCLIHHLLAFFFLSTCVFFEKPGAGGRWIETSGSVLVVFCVFNLLYQRLVLGGRVRRKRKEYDGVRITSLGSLSNLFHFCIINYNMTRVKHELTS